LNHNVIKHNSAS